MIRECVVRGCPRVGYASPRMVCEDLAGKQFSAALDMPHCQRHMEQVSLASIITDEVWSGLVGAAEKQHGEALLQRDRLRLEWVLL